MGQDEASPGQVTDANRLFCFSVYVKTEICKILIRQKRTYSYLYKENSFIASSAEWCIRPPGPVPKCIAKGRPQNILQAL